MVSLLLDFLAAFFQLLDDSIASLANRTEVNVWLQPPVKIAACRDHQAEAFRQGGVKSVALLIVVGAVDFQSFQPDSFKSFQKSHVNNFSLQTRVREDGDTLKSANKRNG